MAKNLRSSYPRRRDFERGANLLKECIEGQRINFAAQMEHMFDSLTRVKMLPNGRLNLDTVDELVRSTFHMLVMNPFKEFDETKK